MLYIKHHGIKGMRWGHRKNKHLNKIKKENKIKKFIREFKEGMAEARIENGQFAINTALHDQEIAMMQSNQMVMQEQQRIAMGQSLMAASLGASGGTNPFMFGGF